MAKIVENGGDEFMIRVMDIVNEAGHRQLEKNDPKKIREFVSTLDAVNEERRAAFDLRKEQKVEYDKLYGEMETSLKILSRGELLKLPETVRLDLENLERKIRATSAKKAADNSLRGEQVVPELE